MQSIEIILGKTKYANFTIVYKSFAKNYKRLLNKFTNF